ncbi:hypothetical protein LguiA_035957 [Lonicera macranthoides]
MSIPILEACRKRKRRPKFFGFHTFADPGCPINPSGPFRDNIRLFLQECAEIEDYNVDGMPTWCTLLVHENRNFVVPLYTIEESVKSSLRPFRDQCRCTGGSRYLCGREIKQVIRYYQDLSETQLITIRDLLRVMLTLKSQAPAQRKSIMATALSSSTSSRPSTRRALLYSG